MATPDEGRRPWRVRLDDTTTLEVAAPRRATEKQVRRRGRVSLVLGTLVAAVALAAVAYADNVQNDVVASGTPATKLVTITAGDATGATVNYNIAETAGDSTDTNPPNPQRCNAADGTSATVTPSGMPSGVTADPASVIFTNCTSSKGITFKASATTTPDDYEISVSVTDAGAASGDYNTNPAKFTLRVEAASADTTAPTITITTPPDGATYLLNQVVDADYGCEDEAGGSGLASCVGTVADGAEIDTSSVGAKTFTVEAADNAGNTNSLTHGYNVVYDFDGFFQPVENPDVWNKAKAGQGIPVKFSLDGDQGLDIFENGYPKAVQVACPSASGSTYDAVETTTANSSGLIYDADADQYVYVWKTAKTLEGKCYKLKLGLNDGSSWYALFDFRR